MHPYTLLSLGDSYTIGEGVLLHKSFPYQVVQLLRKKGLDVTAPEIIAKTGWTTDELSSAIENYSFLPKYNFVSLLIGVNNQYRGRSVEQYKTEFENLLKQAILLAHGKKDHVIALSIPDYTITPFAQSQSSVTNKTASEIDLYNSVNKAVSLQYKVKYVDITHGTRKAEKDTSLLTTDGLHPSEKEYGRWAKMIVDLLLSEVKKN
ncbi:MAG TPA: SGNH/GDSL hydrolase family protein [Chitinophagaceae bacterium]|nr:SGNH/GDSL hydrolase family protein [Chitinophagaceae bacterium]